MNVLTAMLGQPEQRATIRRDPIADWLRDFFTGGTTSAAGVTVNEEKALGLVSYFAAVRNISEDIAKLPIKVHRNLGDRGREEQPAHPVQRLVHDEPNPEMGAYHFWLTAMAHKLAYKGHLSEIQRDRAGRPTALWPIAPNLWRADRDEDGTLIFKVRPDEASAEAVTMQQRDVFYLHGIGGDGITAWVLATLMKDEIGAAIATIQHRGSFFANGTVASGAIQVPEALSDTAFNRLRDSFEKRYTNAENHYKTVILEEGAQFNPFSFDPEKAQMAESMQFDVQVVARLFRINPNKLMDLAKANYNTLFEENRSYVQDTLQPHSIEIKQEIRRKLFTDRERRDGFEAEHNFGMLLMGNMQEQNAAFQIGLTNGWNTINDVLRMQNRNPISAEEGGDTRFVPSNLMPIDRALNPPESQPPALPPSDEEPDDEAPEETERDREIRNAYEPVFIEAVARIMRAEADKLKRAKKRGKEHVEAWIGDFYAKQADYVADQIESLMTAYAASCNLPITSDDIRQVAEASGVFYVAESEKEIHDNGDLLGAISARAHRFVNQILDSLEKRGRNT